MQEPQSWLAIIGFITLVVIVFKLSMWIVTFFYNRGIWPSNSELLIQNRPGNQNQNINNQNQNSVINNSNQYQNTTSGYPQYFD